MRALFPAPRYELPNDWFFELTGLLQTIPAATIAFELARLLSSRLRSRDDGPRVVTARTSRVGKVAQWTIRLTGPAQVLLGSAFWIGRALSLRPAHMLVGLLFDLALVSLVILASIRGLRRVAVFGGVTLALGIPVFGAVQARILPGPAHWIVRLAHLLSGIVAMVVAARLARFVNPASVVASREESSRSITAITRGQSRHRAVS